MSAANKLEPSFSEFTRILDNLLDAIFVVDAQRRILYVNESFRQLCELPRRAVSSREDVTKYIELPEDCYLVMTGAPQLQDELRRYREVDFKTKNGNEGRVQVLVDRVDPALFGEDGLFMFFLRDVTVEARLHAKYKAQIASNEHLISQLKRSLSETAFLRGLAMDLPIYADTAALLTAITKRMKAELGFRDACFFRLRELENGQVEAISLDQRMGSRLREVVRSMEARLRERGTPVGGTVTSMVFEPFGTFWLASMKPKNEKPVVLVASADSNGVADYRGLLEALSGQVCTLLDNRALYIASITDPLTGLFNRRFFDSRLGVECARARENLAPLTLVILDVDYFKSVNDAYGHPAGDAVLAKLGSLIKKRIRTSDFGARVGGEEFALLLPETSPADAWTLAEQLRQQVATTAIPLPGTNREIMVSVSCGIAGFPWPNDGPELLYQAADAGLYRAKQLGRNRSVVNDGALTDEEAE